MIQKSRLFFQDGNSDKVYEVDLVDTGSTDDNAKYLVNFRYGRRGANLREGTKTSAPVSLEKAQKLFDSVVISKTNKGYRDSLSPSSPSKDPISAPTNSASLLDRIRHEKHPDARARQVWRLPPEKNEEAAALVSTFLGQKSDLHEYTMLWTLGRIGDEAQINLITPYLRHNNEMLAQLAVEVIFALTPENERKERYQSLRTNQDDITPEALKKSLSLFNDADTKRATSVPIGPLLKTAYLQALVDKNIRRALLDILPKIPFTPGAFRGVRYLLKMSEFRMDVEVFSALSIRLEQSKPHFNREWRVLYNEHGRLNVEEELASDHARLAHSQKTHRYLVSRYSRVLKRLGVSQSDRFIELAEATLLQYNADHAKPARSTPQYRWDENWRRQLIATLHYDEYAHCAALNTLLRANNPAYSKNRRGIWRFDPDTHFDGRGDAFPERWNTAPDSLLRIACRTACEPISDFAIRALEDNTDFLETLSLDDVIRLFTKPFTRSQAFASTRLKHLLASQPVTSEILVLLFNSGLAAPISLGLELLGQKRDFDDMLTAIAHALCIDPSIALSDHTSVIAWLDAPEQKAKFTFVDKSALLSAVLSVVSEKDFTSKEHATQTFDWLMTQCHDELTNARTTSLPDIATAEVLIQSPSINLALFGCKLLDAMPIAYHQISEATLSTIQASDDEDIQAFAIALLKKLTHDELAGKLGYLLGSLAKCAPAQQHATLSVFAETMKASSYNESNAKNQQAIVEHMVSLLHANKLEDSLQQQLLDFLRKHGRTLLRDETHNESLWKLATARSEMAHTLASEHFEERTPFSRFTAEQGIALLNSPTLALREHAQEYFGDSPDELVAQMDNIVSVMESEWQDTQGFVFNFCRESLSRDQWTPDQIVAVCDSVMEPVQRFGRELVQTYFDQGDAEQYLLQLSQHPAANVELFVSQLLPQHASNNETTIVALQPYFVSVLTRVNTGRPAKDNVIRFLTAQANTSDAVRAMLSQLLTRLSLTSVQKDKAEYIKLMMHLKQTHGDLALPVELKVVRHAAHHELEE
ncbi:WGR domain-containing protein [Enterovibrio calviensis]|uniref:WGR domain-containing protein n=1 Tax=Enterovibrio calviensis TaxID=91359 RepID=UPI000B1EE8D9|nr:WGR domain-containing protein [Enterovibrio calviensis]